MRRPYRRRPTFAEIERTSKAVELRKAGLTYEQIAEELGCSQSSAHGMVTRAFRQYMIDHGVQDEIAAELNRLDAMLRAVWPKVLGGEYEAIDRALKIGKRRAEILGLDAPKVKKVEHLDRNSIEAELAALAARSGRPIPPRVIDTTAQPALNP